MKKKTIILIILLISFFIFFYNLGIVRSKVKQYLPLKTKRSFKKDELIKIDDVEVNLNQEVLKAREYQIKIKN